MFEFAFGQRWALEFPKCIFAGVHNGNPVFADETKVFFLLVTPPETKRAENRAINIRDWTSEYENASFGISTSQPPKIVVQNFKAD